AIRRLRISTIRPNATPRATCATCISPERTSRSTNRASITRARSASVLVMRVAFSRLAASLGLGLVAAFVLLAPSARAQPATGITGEPTPRLASFDRLVEGLLQKYEIAGAALAVVKDGRLVLAHGYGFANTEQHQPVQPD